MNKQYLVRESADFQTVIEDILSSSQLADFKTIVISLEGDLGAGKTTFVQQLGIFFGIEEPITSPTFTIMKQYSFSKDRFNQLVHIDAYRIESEEEVEPLHLDLVLQRPKTIVCIEWPSQIKSVIPDNAVKISIIIRKDETRQVEVSYI